MARRSLTFDFYFNYLAWILGGLGLSANFVATIRFQRWLMNRALLLHNVRLFLLIVTLLFPCLFNAQAKIRIVMSSDISLNGSVRCAEDKGFFKKCGSDDEAIAIAWRGMPVIRSLV